MYYIIYYSTGTIEIVQTNDVYIRVQPMVTLGSRRAKPPLVPIVYLVEEIFWPIGFDTNKCQLYIALISVLLFEKTVQLLSKNFK